MGDTGDVCYLQWNQSIFDLDPRRFQWGAGRNGEGAVHSAARGFQMFMSKRGLAKHLEMRNTPPPEVQYKLLFQNSSS